MVRTTMSTVRPKGFQSGDHFLLKCLGFRGETPHCSVWAQPPMAKPNLDQNANVFDEIILFISRERSFSKEGSVT